MLLHEQKNDETTKAENDSHGGEKEGKENIFNPMTGKVFGDCTVPRKKSLDHRGVSMGKKMIHRYTAWQSGVIRVTSAEENMGGGQTCGEDTITMTLIDGLRLIVIYEESIWRKGQMVITSHRYDL